VALWLTAMAAALVVTFLVAKRIMRPVAELGSRGGGDRAAELRLPRRRRKRR